MRDHEATKNDCIVFFLGKMHRLTERVLAGAPHFLTTSGVPKLGDLIFLAKNH